MIEKFRSINSSFKYVHIIGVLQVIIFVLMTHCASQRAPGGGPEDKTAPELIASNLENGSLNVSTETEFIFYFSEPLDEVSVKRGLTLFPLNLTEITVRYRHKRIIVKPIGNWEEDQAYSLVIDNTISDLRRNPINGSISYSFSTGNSIPKGKVKGKIYGLERNESATVILGDPAIPLDSLFILYQYFAQSSDDGYFSFNYLPEKPFKMIAYLDKDKSRKYEPQRDDLALPINPEIRASSDSILVSQEFKVVRGNFLKPLLLSAKMQYPGKLSLKYSKHPSFSENYPKITLDGIKIDTLISDMEYIYVYYPPTKNDSLNLHLPPISDNFRCVSDDSSLTIKKVEFLDTLYTVKWENSYLQISPDPYLDSLKLNLRTTDDTSDVVFMREKAGIYRADLPMAMNAATNFMLPANEYYLSILDSVEYKIKVITLAETGFGSLSFQYDSEEKTVMQLISRENSYVKRVGKNENIIFEAVVPGNYSLYTFVDRNANNKADDGRLEPYESPEIVKFVIDNIEIRKNWETSLTSEELKKEDVNAKVPSRKDY